MMVNSPTNVVEVMVAMLAVTLLCGGCQTTSDDGNTDDPIAPPADVTVLTSSSGNWTDDIWGLDGTFPDNDDETFDVTIDGSDVLLDRDISVDSLRILNNGRLRMTEETQADLSIVGDKGVMLEGRIDVDRNRVFTVSDGPIEIGNGGRYGPSDDATNATAQLNAKTIRIFEAPTGGELKLDMQMSAAIQGALSLETPADDGDNDDDGGIVTSCTPPSLYVASDADVVVGGNFELDGAPTVTHQSSQALRLRGDFANRSTAPAQFAWAEGRLQLDGVGATQAFEAAGTDFGGIEAGFVSNFTIGDLNIASDSQVTFSDTFDNDNVSGGDCSEAVYIKELTLENGSEITIENCNVYVQSLVDLGATINQGGSCGSLQVVELATQSNEIILHSEWSDGTANIYGELVWSLPASMGTFEQRQGFDANPSGASTIVEDNALGVDGIHALRFDLVGAANALGDIRFEVRFLNYSFAPVPNRMKVGATHTILLSVKDGCATELGNTWRKEVGEAILDPPDCEDGTTIQMASTWIDGSLSFSPADVFGEFVWWLPASMGTIERRQGFDARTNGSVGIAEDDVLAVNGVHKFDYFLVGKANALADVDFNVGFLGRKFSNNREKMRVGTTHTINVFVNDGCVTELGNTWRKELGEALTPPEACDDHSTVQISSTWVDGNGDLFNEIIWSLPNSMGTIEQRQRFDARVNGGSAVARTGELAVDGVHEIRFELVGAQNASGDVEFRLQFLDYEFSMSLEDVLVNTTHTIELNVAGGVVTELSNSLRVN
ncbi:MAG: hypothetical protein KDA54_00115 [Phycisphaerales bacterium]|nr:hypothetical protein [Phycisphaerales bacterium]